MRPSFVGILFASFVLCIIRADDEELLPAESEVSNASASDTLIQVSNPYCSSPRSNRIVCNFNGTAARLGNLDLFFADSGENTSSLQDALHLEIVNCSTLTITSEFQTGWRESFTTLYLRIDQIDNVVQEEAEAEQDLKTSDVISFSMRNSNMSNIFPNLMSNTKALLVDMQDCQVGNITEGTFRRVDKLWQLRIFRTNITKIESRAAPCGEEEGGGGAAGLSVAPAAIQVEWAPFILNETRIDLFNVDALCFDISEKDEYLNVVNSNFGVMKKGGLRIMGSGHVLVADSVFQRVENDAFVVQLRAARDGQDLAENLKFLAHPTLTMMGVQVTDANVTNFLDNLQIYDGKIYLIRMNFTLPGALGAVVGHARLWNNQTTFIERWTVTCSCIELASLIRPESDGINEVDGPNYDDPPDETTPSVSHWRREVKCRPEMTPSNSSFSLTLVEFQQNYCPVPSTEKKDDSTEMDSNNNTSTVDPHKSEENIKDDEEERLNFIHLGVGGACFLILIIAVVSVYLYRNRKVSFRLNRRTKADKRQRRQNPANKKQVGIISEDPICGEEGEEECQL